VTGHLVRRLIDLVVTVWGVSTMVFVVLRLSGDPVALFVTESASAADIERIRHSLGFDEPMWLQYGRFLGGVLQGDFGNSLRFSRPALPLVLQTLPATLELTLVALALATLLAIPLGILAAVRKNRWLDQLVMVGALFGQAMPFFWLGLLLILLFAVNLHLLPALGSATPQHLVLPACTLAAYSLARTTRLVRSGMLDVLGEDYVRTARAKGLDERHVLFSHALRNVILPVFTIIWLEFGTLVGGAVVTETIFSWPGVGRLVVQAIQARDYPIVQAAVFVIAVLVVIASFLIDLANTWADPRLRTES
jgi:peptide/nickel transport system permease protein